MFGRKRELPSLDEAGDTFIEIRQSRDGEGIIVASKKLKQNAKDINSNLPEECVDVCPIARICLEKVVNTRNGDTIPYAPEGVIFSTDCSYPLDVPYAPSQWLYNTVSEAQWLAKRGGEVGPKDGICCTDDRDFSDAPEGWSYDSSERFDPGRV